MLNTNFIYKYIKNLISENFNGLENELKRRDYTPQKKNDSDCKDSAIYLGKDIFAQIHYVNNTTRLSFKKEFSKLFFNFEIYELKSQNAWINIDLNHCEELIKLNEIFLEIIESSATKDIGCCSHYKECSLERRCVNQYPEIFLHCYYRKNLKEGKVFF